MTSTRVTVVTMELDDTGATSVTGACTICTALHWLAPWALETRRMTGKRPGAGYVKAATGVTCGPTGSPAPKSHVWAVGACAVDAGT